MIPQQNFPPFMVALASSVSTSDLIYPPPPPICAKKTLMDGHIGSDARHRKKRK